MFKTNYIFPIATVILLFLFFLGIPDLGKTRLKKSTGKLLTKADVILMAAITLIFGVVDFIGLGNTTSPETFEYMPDKTVYIEFSSSQAVNNILLFPGVGEGYYNIDYSEDGVDYYNFLEFYQHYNTVLKWQNCSPDYFTQAKYYRIYASGNVYLGELAFSDANGDLISYTASGSDRLNDEQSKVCFDENFMNSSYFDEIYHARTAWENLNGVYPYEISHPPLGKIILSLGILLFGMTPFGWRFSGTMIGVLMLPVLYVFAKRMFASTRAAACTALIFATDFMHFVQTRIATIDSYAVFFIILMYLFMFGFVSTGSRKSLAFSGVFFGLGAASKWTCIYAGAGLALIWVVYWIINRKAGIKVFLKNALFCFLFFVLVPVLIYMLSYIPYAKALQISVFSLDYLKEIINNQQFMFSYHSNLVATHPYSSVWYQWIFDIRPILYYLKYYTDGTRQSFGAFMNPILCWGGLISLFLLIYYAVVKRCRTALFIIIGYLAQLVPWMFVTRLTFEYHYFPCGVFLALAIGYVISIMENGSKHYRPYIYSLTALSVLLFIFFYPTLSGKPVDNAAASKLYSWLSTWPF